MPHSRRRPDCWTVPLFPKGSNDDDRYKTGCVGVLLPLFAAAYGVRAIIRQRTPGGLRYRPTVGPEAVEWGIAALGVAVFVHAWGFEPYKRHPWIRAILTVVGVAMFLKGVIREL